LVTQAALKDSGTQIPDKVRIALGNGDSIIRAWRGYLGISQGELASRAGIAQYAFALMEKPNADIDEESLSKLASALGVSVDQLRTKL
jgi:transcriptional regulator with XRE-family HTH domain